MAGSVVAVSQAGGGRGVSRVPSAVPVSAPIVRRLVLVPSHGSSARTPLIAVDIDTLQGYEVDEFDGLGFSLGSIVKNIGNAVTKAVSDTKNAVVKAAVDTGHVAGTVATSGVGKAVIGGALALTGVGIPAAIAIGAATQGIGTLIKPGGNIGQAIKQGAVGGAEGAAVSVAGKAIQKFAPSITSGARSAVNKLLPGNPFSPSSTPAAPPETAEPIRKTAVIGPVRGAKTQGIPLQAPPSINMAPAMPSIVPLGLPPTPYDGSAPPQLPAVSGPSIIDRATTAVDRVKKAAGQAKKVVSDNTDVLNAIQQLAQSGQPPVMYAGGGGGVPMTGGDMVAPASAAPAPQVGTLSGIPPVALLAAGGLVLYLLSRKR